MTTTKGTKIHEKRSAFLLRSKLSTADKSGLRRTSRGYGGQVGATADKSGLRRTRRLDKAECIAISFCFIAFFVEKAINQNFMEQCMFASGETAGFDSY
jgi:hypothetical protein